MNNAHSRSTISPGSPSGARRIVVATRNAGKIEELRALLRDAGQRFTFLGLAEIESELGLSIPEPAEDHTASGTFAGNAQTKAAAYAKATGAWCLGDDSGLEVDALNGRPGVVSSHFAWDGVTTGEPATLDRPQRDARNNERLLHELQSVPPEQRTARFVCHMAIASPGGSVICESRGTFEGRIGVPPHVPRGDNGFGYDPLFVVGPAFERTSAELSAAEKNKLSHRGDASRGLLRALLDLRTQ